MKTLPLAVLIAFTCLAAMGQDEPWRRFTDQSGRQFQARVVKIDGGSVVLRQSDGKPLTVPIASLRPEDQEFVRLVAGLRSVRVDALFTKRKVSSEIVGKAGASSSQSVKRSGERLFRQNLNKRTRAEDWRYEILLTNRSHIDIGPLTVEYRQFVENVSTTRDSGGRSQDKATVVSSGSLPVDNLPSLRTVSLQTQPQTLHSSKSLEKRSSPDGMDFTSREHKGELDSIWIRVYGPHHILVHESRSSGNLARKAEW